MKTENRGEIVIFKAADGQTAIHVRLEQETVWLNQSQLAELFKTNRTSILKHIRNIYKTGELVVESTCAKIAQVQKEGGRRISRNIFYYNLDLIISVGYRVNSKRGTQFRIWATRVLHEHLVKGFTVNKRRLKELHQTVHLITEIAEHRDLSGDEAKALLRVVEDYTYALNLLDDYDHQRVVIADTTDNIFQTFEGKDLYLSLEEKAANLLYFLVKNHSFVDGNKRIAAALFLWFLEKNRMLYRADGTKRIAENALVAMTLLIAESKAADKEILAQVVTNLLTKKNR